MVIAKNYLSEPELDILNRFVTAYLEIAEIQALRKNEISEVEKHFLKQVNDTAKKLKSKKKDK